MKKVPFCFHAAPTLPREEKLLKLLIIQAMRDELDPFRKLANWTVYVDANQWL